MAGREIALSEMAGSEIALSEMAGREMTTIHTCSYD